MWAPKSFYLCCVLGLCYVLGSCHCFGAMTILRGLYDAQKRDDKPGPWITVTISAVWSGDPIMLMCLLWVLAIETLSLAIAFKTRHSKAITEWHGTFTLRLGNCWLPLGLCRSQESSSSPFFPISLPCLTHSNCSLSVTLKQTKTPVCLFRDVSVRERETEGRENACEN